MPIISVLEKYPVNCWLPQTWLHPCWRPGPLCPSSVTLGPVCCHVSSHEAPPFLPRVRPLWPLHWLQLYNKDKPDWECFPFLSLICTFLPKNWLTRTAPPVAFRATSRPLVTCGLTSDGVSSGVMRSRILAPPFWIARPVTSAPLTTPSLNFVAPTQRNRFVINVRW